MGTIDGLCILDGESSEPVTNFQSFPINDISVDNFGNVWVGTNGEGLNVFDGDIWSRRHINF